MATPQLIKSKYVRVQKFSDTTLGISLPHEYVQYLGLEHKDTLRTWVTEDGIIHVGKTEA